MTTLNIDLADILEHKLQFGFSVPVPIDVDQLLEYADDDWRHELELDGLLAVQRKVAVIVSADEIKEKHPHLTHEQAWEIAAGVGDHLRDGLFDWIDDIVWMDYPSALMKLIQRVRDLRFRLGKREDRAGQSLYGEVYALQRLLETGDDVWSDPAVIGRLAAVLDDAEAKAEQGGNA